MPETDRIPRHYRVLFAQEWPSPPARNPPFCVESRFHPSRLSVPPKLLLHDRLPPDGAACDAEQPVS